MGNNIDYQTLNFKYQNSQYWGDNIHDFVFGDWRYRKYLVLAIKGNNKVSPGTAEHPPQIIESNDLFFQPNRCNESAQKILLEILNDKDKMGYKVWEGLEGYEKHIWLENKFNSANIFVPAGLKKTEPLDFNYRVKPYADFNLLIKQYQQNLISRIDRFVVQIIDKSEPIDTKNEIEVLLIGKILNEVNQDIKQGVQYKINDWTFENLSSAELATANKFIQWLNKRKEFLAKYSEVNNVNFEKEKKSFQKTFDSYNTTKEKQVFLSGHIIKTQKCINQFKDEPHLLGEGFEGNKKYLSEAIQFLEYLEKLNGELNPKEEMTNSSKDKLTHKQQILLLKQLGFFELEFFNELNETQKGVLISHIVHRDEKNSEDNVRYVRGKRANEDTKKIFTKENIKKVNELLENVGLNKYKVK